MYIKHRVLKLAAPGQGYTHDDLPLKGAILALESRNANGHLSGNSAAPPVISGKLPIGFYQDIIHADLDGPRRRNVIMTLNRN